MQPLPTRAPLPTTLAALSPQTQSRQSLKKYSAIAALAGAQAVVDAVSRGQTLPPPPAGSGLPGAAPGLPGAVPPGAAPSLLTPGALSTGMGAGTPSALPPLPMPGPGAPAGPAGVGPPAGSAPALTPPPAPYAEGGVVRGSSELLPGVVPASVLVAHALRALSAPRRYAEGGDVPGTDTGVDAGPVPGAGGMPPDVGGSLNAVPDAGLADGAARPPSDTPAPPAFVQWLQSATPQDEFGQMLVAAFDQGTDAAELWAVVQQLAQLDPSSLPPELKAMTGAGAGPKLAQDVSRRMGPPGTGPLPGPPPPPRGIAA